jgi:hypothetical protein
MKANKRAVHFLKGTSKTLCPLAIADAISLMVNNIPRIIFFIILPSFYIIKAAFASCLS